MSIDAHISCSACQALVLSILNVFPALWINELFSETKIDNMDNVLIWCAMPTHKEILGLNVTIYQVLAVYILDSGNLGGRERGRGRGRERVVGGEREEGGMRGYGCV